MITQFQPLSEDFVTHYQMHIRERETDMFFRIIQDIIGCHIETYSLCTKTRNFTLGISSHH